MKESKTDGNHKDFEIQRLTRELVILRLKHAHCGKVAVRGEKEPENTLPFAATSLADSGHFDDLSYQASQLKDSLVEKDVGLLASDGLSAEKSRIANFHAEKMEDLLRRHANEVIMITFLSTEKCFNCFTILDTASKKSIYRSS